MEQPQQYLLDQSTGISYAIVPESGPFDSLHTLVEVCNLLPNQDEQYQVAMVVDADTGNSQPRHTILAQRVSGGPGDGVTNVGQPPSPRRMETSRTKTSSSGDADKPVRRRGNGAAQIRPCEVCGEHAGRHSYYGGQVCPSCRAFFRRSVQSGYNLSYCCVKSGDCSVTLRTRKNCQYCRYKRCLDVGMKTTWVLSEEERKKKFEGRKITKKRRRKSQDEDNEDDECCDEPSRVDLYMISDEETVEINKLIEISGYHENSKVNDMETSLIRDIIRMIAFKATLPKEGQLQLRTVLSRRFRRLAKRLKEFQGLPNAHREEILNGNIPVLVELQICTFFNPDLLWREQLTLLIGAEEVDRLYRKLKTLNVQHLDDRRVDYVDMFGHSSVTDENFLEMVKDIGSWSQDPYEYVLLCKVLMFCPDVLSPSIPLVQNIQTQNTQNKFAVLLYKYLNKKHQNEPGIAVSRFAGGINVVTKCKHLYNLWITELKQEVVT